jgi:hypothetical protein
MANTSRKIDPQAMLATAARQVGIRETDKMILQVQLEAEAMLQETIEDNAKSTERLTRIIGIATIVIGFATLVVTAVGVYIAFVASGLAGK